MSLDENIRALARTPVLADAGRDALRLLAFSAETLRLQPGDVLFAEGDAADCAYTVMRGRVRMDAGENRILTVGRGTLIGEMALLVPTVRPCAAVAVDEADLLAIPRPLFLRMLEEFPAMALTLRGRLLGRLRVEQTALERVRARLDQLPND